MIELSRNHFAYVVVVDVMMKKEPSYRTNRMNALKEVIIVLKNKTSEVYTILISLNLPSLCGSKNVCCYLEKEICIHSLRLSMSRQWRSRSTARFTMSNWSMWTTLIYLGAHRCFCIWWRLIKTSWFWKKIQRNFVLLFTQNDYFCISVIFYYFVKGLF